MATATVTTPVYVQVQTLRGTQGTVAAFAEVEKAVAAYNALNSKATPHLAKLLTALPNNTKGMQWQLALLATLARQHGATMIRLSVHNGNVAICGTKAAIEAVQTALIPAYNAYSTLAANAYNPTAHGNRVGFNNGYLCGCPAGLQSGLGIVTTLAYGVGFLFTFPAPGTGTAYALGQAASAALVKPATAKPATAKPATAKSMSLADYEALTPVQAGKLSKAQRATWEFLANQQSGPTQGVSATDYSDAEIAADQAAERAAGIVA